MTSKTFLKNIEELKKLLDSSDFLIQYLNNISANNEDFLNISLEFERAYVRNSAPVTLQNMTKINGDKDKLVRVVNQSIRQVTPFSFILELKNFEDGIKKLELFSPKKEESFYFDIEKISELHTEAYSERNYKEAYRFTLGCKSFLDKLNNIYFTYNFITQHLTEESIDIPKGNEVIDIEIISKINPLENFVNFIHVIDMLYRELCIVYEIHYEDYPLTIIKIESGSIWEKLFGFKEIIGLIKDLIFGLANYIRDIQTGKLQSEKMENLVGSMSLILDLREKAKDCGVDDKNLLLLNKTVKKAIVALSKAIPESTTEIILDDEKLLNLNKTQTKLIESKPKKLLKKNNDNKGKKDGK